MMDRNDRIARQREIFELLKGEGKFLWHLPGVQDVGVSFRYKDKVKTQEMVIRVTVAVKLPLEEIAPEDRVPATIAGIPTDIVEARPKRLTACTHKGDNRDDHKRRDFLAGGISISNPTNDGLGPSPGTLGCIAFFTNPEDADDPDNGPVLLSNHHVFCNGGLENDTEVAHPIYRYCSCKHNVVGHVIDFDVDLDCAIAKPNGALPVKNTIVDIEGGIQGVADLVDAMFAVTVGDLVKKRGKRTRLTHGSVIAVSASTKRMQIESTSDVCFNLSGDSGSVVLDSDNKVVGLIAEGAEEEVSPGVWEETGEAFAIPIHLITARLNIEIRATDTSSDIDDAEPEVDKGRARLHRNLRRSNARIMTPHAEEIDIGHMLKSMDVQLGQFWNDHGYEIFYMLDHCRPAKAIWNRHKGPQLVGALLAEARKEHPDFRMQLEKQHPHRLLLQFAAVLQGHGSASLARDVGVVLPIALRGLVGVGKRGDDENATNR